MSKVAYATGEENGFFGDYGGMYVPEILVPPLQQLTDAFNASREDKAFNQELKGLLKDYAGRPTPLYRCRNLCADSNTQIYLKREDLLHGGAHKTNQVLAQALLAKQMGKKRIIAETGAGQHGVATALACSLMGLDATIYMGAEDISRQAPNVYRMELMGAKVIPVTAGSGTLKDAINEALRDWAASYEYTHYLLGTAAGPHPFPVMVREFQKVIGEEAKRQMLEQAGRLPDAAIACVGGGSNAIGLFADFIEEESVELIGVEPGGKGESEGLHGMTLKAGKEAVVHGSHTLCLQDKDGQIQESYSISAGLDYPAVGPQHVRLKQTGRAQYGSATDVEALAAFQDLSKQEGIIPALESSHALAYAIKRARSSNKSEILLVNLSGRGDKDLQHVMAVTKSLNISTQSTSGEDC